MKRKRKHNGSNKPDVLKGLLAGIIGGLVATVVMDQFQNLWNKVSGEEEEEQGKQDSQQQKSGQKGGQQAEAAKQGGEEEEPATEKAAEAVSEGIFDHHLTKSEKKTGGSAMHYTMGLTSGAIYGVTAELMPSATVGAGVPFGAMIWLIADETLLPALGLSKAPTAYPLSKHAYGLASHFVYGLTADVVRRTVRNAL